MLRMLCRHTKVEASHLVRHNDAPHLCVKAFYPCFQQVISLALDGPRPCLLQLQPGALGLLLALSCAENSLGKRSAEHAHGPLVL